MPGLMRTVNVRPPSVTSGIAAAARGCSLIGRARWSYWSSESKMLSHRLPVNSSDSRAQSNPRSALVVAVRITLRMSAACAVARESANAAARSFGNTLVQRMARRGRLFRRCGGFGDGCRMVEHHAPARVAQLVHVGGEH